MEIKTIITVVIAGMLGAIVFSSMLPVFAETTSADTTFTNESYYKLDKITNESDVTIRWEKSTPNIISINGNSFDMGDLPTGRAYTIIGSTSLMVRYSVFGATTFIELLGSRYINDSTGVDDLTFVQISINGNALNYLNDRTSPYNYDFTLEGDSYYIVGDGDGSYSEVMKDSSKPAYVKGDSSITLIGSNTPVRVGVYGVGSIDDGITLSTVYKANTVATDVEYSTPVGTYTKVSGYNDLYLLDHYDFTMTYDETTENAVYSYFIVPSEVTAEKVNHPDGPTKAIMDLLPILIGIGLVIGIAGVVLARRF